MRALKTMEEVIAEEQDVLTDYLTDAVYEIDGLTIPHDIKGFEIEQTQLKAVRESENQGMFIYYLTMYYLRFIYLPIWHCQHRWCPTNHQIAKS